MVAPVESQIDDDAQDEEPSGRLSRDQDLLGRSNSKLRAKLLKDFDDIHKAFTDSVDRTDNQLDYWDCYNCVLNDHQFYEGQTEAYVPIVRDAINAIVTRFSNQLCPPGGHYVEATTADGAQPLAELAIVDHYIRELRLKTAILKPLLRNGYVEGQYNLYVDWQAHKRQIVSRETHGVELGPEMDNAVAPGDDIEDVSEEDIEEGAPSVKVLHDSDVMVRPATADSIEEALDGGGDVTIVRRWSKGKLRQMIDDGHINKADGEDILEAMSTAGAQENVPRDAEKALREHVGIKQKGGHVVVWETWKMLALGDGGAYAEKGTPRLCRIFYCATGDKEKIVLGAKRNPNWNDRCPLLSAPVEKVAGVFKGESPVAPIASLQYIANDALNEGADADTYAAGPIVARNPEKSQANLMFNIGAVWDVDPADVKFMEFPDLGERAIRRIQFCVTAIFQSLSVSPAMLPQQTGRPGAKRNQAETAIELQADLLNTDEGASVAEESILTRLAEWFVDLDHQHRERELTVRRYGEMGLQAVMESISPLRNRAAFQLNWVGSQMSRNNVAVMQQGVALLNVARGMGQQLKEEGQQLRIAPVLQKAFANNFGPELARLTLVDIKSQLTVEADLENMLMSDGHDLQVHPLDNDPEHMASHQQAMQTMGDPHGTIRVHIGRHIISMQIKNAATLQKQQGAPGVPGGAGRGVAGTPRQGAQPGQQRPAQAPPGAIHQDRMPSAGVVQMPRRM